MARLKQTLADLRPNATITCMLCERTKPQAGAVKFRAHMVCAECTRKLRTNSTPTAGQPPATTP